MKIPGFIEVQPYLSQDDFDRWVREDSVFIAIDAIEQIDRYKDEEDMSPLAIIRLYTRNMFVGESVEQIAAQIRESERGDQVEIKSSPETIKLHKEQLQKLLKQLERKIKEGDK